VVEGHLARPDSPALEELRDEVAQLRTEIAELREQRAELDDVQSRLDFTERLLAQRKESP
jgi:prefoldin subunit 5